MTDVRKIGLIGVGPRGGYALERLVFELANRESISNIHLSLYERTGNFGNGQVYDLNQNTSNWINITERILELNEREAIVTEMFNIPSFPSYHQWIQKDFKTLPKDEADTYPPRAQIGEYLSLRFQSLIKPLIESNTATLYKEEVKEIDLLKNNKINIVTDSRTYNDFDEVLLTIGHQLTELSEQIQDWDNFATDNKNITLFKAPYPTTAYINHENVNIESIIAIRGFGLAMIDVVRGISMKFGRYALKDEKAKSCTYLSDKELRMRFVPFSLDGLPPAPKPLNAKIDSWFEPSKTALSNFEKQIGNKQIQQDAESHYFLLAAFAPVAAEVYVNIPNRNDPLNLSRKSIEDLVMQWLKDQDLEHPLIVSSKQSARKIMEEFVDMAIGKKTISLDYCIGQVWRHCQPSIYKQLSHNHCNNTVFAEIIELDESTKRYSYGPPVESIQQLLAMTEAGVLNLDFVKDPDIELTENGWQLHVREESISAAIMIDSVLDAPKIKFVRSSIVENLLNDDLIKVIHDDLGVKTDEHGYLISELTDRKIPIALLGRLAKGTVIGVDAILECFGTRPQQWARQAAENHLKSISF